MLGVRRPAIMRSPRMGTQRGAVLALLPARAAHSATLHRWAARVRTPSTAPRLLLLLVAAVRGRALIAAAALAEVVAGAVPQRALRAAPVHRDVVPGTARPGE